jgi:hypothetical protein
MELVDRYLKAIRSYLPDAQKDDIIRELSENLRSQIEDKEEELGRPLNEAEIEALLKAHGHPLIVAGRYRQDERSFAFGRQLIGPVLFPFYMKVLAFNLGITSVVLIFVFTALIASGQPVRLVTDLPAVFLYQLLIQFAVVTTIFTVVDRHLAKHPDRWDPRKPGHPYYPNLTEKDEARSVPRIESVSKLIALSVWITWLRVIQQSPFWILGPAAAYLKLAPVWHQLYLPVVLVAFAGMAQAGLNLVRPDWFQLRLITRIVEDAAALAMGCFLLRAGHWIAALDTPGSLASGRTIEIINQCVFYSLLVAVVIAGVQVLRGVRRLFHGTPDRVPSGA